MENVPRLLDFQGGDSFSAFEAGLRRADYHVHHEIAYAPDFGVPQQRHRLVLLASRRGPITLDRSMGANASIDVGHAIGALPPLEAGGVDGLDPMHRASGLSKRNLERIRASRPGGTWQLIELVGHPGGGRSDRFPPSRFALDSARSAGVGKCGWLTHAEHQGPYVTEVVAERILGTGCLSYRLRKIDAPGTTSAPRSAR